MNRNATFFVSLLFIFFTFPLIAQIPINSSAISINFNDFTASGFTPLPAPGHRQDRSPVHRRQL